MNLKMVAKIHKFLCDNTEITKGERIEIMNIVTNLNHNKKIPKYVTNRIKQLICFNCNTLLNTGDRRILKFNFYFCCRECSNYHRKFNVNRQRISKKNTRKNNHIKKLMGD